jgi:hypothetical protein
VTEAAPLGFRALWNGAILYERFVQESEQNRPLWEGIYRTANVPEWAIADACREAARVRILAIVEDWCGDASNTVPVLARLGREASCLEMRVVRRDEHPLVMDRYLTNGSRSIPIVILLDAAFREIGHWGPRPSELQAWVMEHKGRIPKNELYPQVRRWYAKDRGRTTLREVLGLLPRLLPQNVHCE